MVHLFKLFFTLSLITFVNASVNIKIKRENEVEVQSADEYIYYPQPYHFDVYSLNGNKIKSYDKILLDCFDTCDNFTVSDSEMRLLSTYASYVHSFGSLPSKVDFGLLKDIDSTNVYGMFVLHTDGRINFFVRHSVFVGVPVETAYLLLLDVAAHEKAHYSNYYNNGEVGHDDDFQREFNSIFWSSLYDVADYKALYLNMNNTVYEESQNSAVAPVIIVVGTVVVLIAICIATQLSKPTNERTARKPLL